MISGFSTELFKIFEEPIDDTHRDSIEAVHAIRRDVNLARRRLGLPLKQYSNERKP